jgi:hypothetical protein
LSEETSAKRSSSAVAASSGAEWKAFTGEEIAGLEEGEESKYSDFLWEEFEKHRDEAISLEEYCSRRGIEI